MSKVIRLIFAFLFAMTLVQPVFAATSGSVATQAISKEVQAVVTSQSPAQKGRFPNLSSGAASQGATQVVQGPLFDNPSVPVTNYGFDANGYMGRFNPEYYFAEMVFGLSALLVNVSLNLFALGYLSRSLGGLIGAVLAILHRTFLLAVHLFPVFALLLVGYAVWDLLVKHAPKRFFTRITKMAVWFFASYVFATLVTVGQVQEVLSATNAIGSLFGNIATAVIEPSAIQEGASLGQGIQLSPFHSTAQLQATSANGNPIPVVKWESDNPSVAIVSSTGEVKGTGVGTTTITGITADGQKIRETITDGQATEELLDTAWTNTILAEWEYAEMGGDVIDQTTHRPFWEELLPYAVGSSQRDALAGTLNSPAYPLAQDAFHAINRMVIAEVSFVSNLGAIAYFLIIGGILFFARILFLIALAAGAFVLPLEMFPSTQTGVMAKKWLQHLLMPLFLTIMVNVYSTMVLGVTQIVNQSGVLQIGNAGGTANVALKILFNGLIYAAALWFAWKLYKKYRPMKLIQNRMDRMMAVSPEPSTRPVPLSKRMRAQSPISRRNPYENGSSVPREETALSEVHGESQNETPFAWQSNESVEDLRFDTDEEPVGDSQFDADDTDDHSQGLAPLSPLPLFPSGGGAAYANNQSWLFRSKQQKNEKGKSENKLRNPLHSIEGNSRDEGNALSQRITPSSKEEREINEKKRAYEAALDETLRQPKEPRVQGRNLDILQMTNALGKGTKAAYFASKKLAPLAIKSTKRLARSPATASELAVDGTAFLASQAVRQAKKGAHWINQRIEKVPEPLYPGRRASVKHVSQKAKVVFHPTPTKDSVVSHKEPEVVQMKEATQGFPSRIRFAKSVEQPALAPGVSSDTKVQRAPIAKSQLPQTSRRVSTIKRPARLTKSTNRQSQTENRPHQSGRLPHRSLRHRLLKDR
ncbi:Ig-like domain-containing protein [Sulfoacidibacillus thermotolerans]|uniref:BIG2 domain-containing protein n=1 Tax=Sulfoacidibacillus thermotolerans TaxID=1765684 RepID=A0A2U3D5R3_SULT2|nr:Ig-like domain-containing protein [Sulfoacidibacillus thermotolerans]PWI56641.1 hypothetical protein BM613_12740 [Sulfoacidibacillus thermotolerans]